MKNRIGLKQVYILVRNLSLVVSGKSCAWRVLGMLPALKKKPTVCNRMLGARNLRLHHAYMKYIVDSDNSFCSADTPGLCADGNVISLRYLGIIPRTDYGRC